jgi:hypothetical protein
MKTVFVLTNAAFQSLPVSELEALFGNKQGNPLIFKSFCGWHYHRKSEYNKG